MEYRGWKCDRCKELIETRDQKISLVSIEITKGGPNGSGKTLRYHDPEKPLDFCGMSCVMGYVQDGLAVDKGQGEGNEL
jgi:hypothetical protein